MKKIKATTLSLFLCLFLVTDISFATDEDDDEPGTGAETEQTTTEDECGFFCSVGEFFEGLFS